MSNAPSSSPMVVAKRTTWNHHWVMLALPLAVVAAAAMLEVLPNERVAIRGLPAYPLPHLCMSRAMFDVSCPGCGLTRCFVHMTHGEWQAAWKVHQLGWLIASLVIAQLPYRALILAGWIQPISARAAQWLAFVVVGLLIASWALRPDTTYPAAGYIHIRFGLVGAEGQGTLG